MSDAEKKQIREAIEALNQFFIERDMDNGVALNALSHLSVHLAFSFGIPKKTYLKDIQIMFDERVKRAVKEAKR